MSDIEVVSIDTEDNDNSIVNNNNNKETNDDQTINNMINPVINQIFNENLVAELETKEAIDFIYLGK